MSRATDDRPTLCAARGGFRVEAVSYALPPLSAVLRPDLEQLVTSERTLRASRYRVTGRVTVPGLGDVLLKVHRSRRLAERLPAFVRPSRARAEWDAARYLSGAGLPVAAALAVGEDRRGPFLRAAFFAARYVDGLSALDLQLPVAPPAAVRAHLDRTARWIRALHDRGFDHRDLHTGNVLADRSGDRILLADLHRSRAGHVVTPRARRAALARWMHAFPPTVGGGGRRRTLAAYLPEGDQETLRSWHVDVERRIARLERTRRRSRAKRCFLESTVYTRDVGAGWGARRRDVSPEQIDAAIREHDDALARDDDRVAKRARKARVTRHGDVVVKESVPFGWGGRLKDAVAPGRHRAGYRGAHLLSVLGIDTARPLAWVRRGGRVFALYENLASCPRLDHLARAVYVEGSRSRQVGLRQASADWVAHLHRRGVYHGDLKGVNVRVGEQDGRFAFHLIDTDRVRVFASGVDRRRRIKNLAQLAASIARVVTRTERLRWFRRYAAGGPLAEDERGVWKEVAAQVARKHAVVDEPIE